MTPLAAAYSPDVVLLDIDLPDMSGTDLLRTLRREHPAIPIVMVTGNHNEATARATLAVGAFDYVSKPFDIDVLGRILQAAIAYRGR